MTDKPTETLLTFPCDFPIKVFGLTSPDFEAEVITIINRHTTPVTKDAIQVRPSENGKYTALSITVHVTSKAILDSIYLDLSSSPLVLMAL